MRPEKTLKQCRMLTNQRKACLPKSNCWPIRGKVTGVWDSCDVMARLLELYREV